MYIVEKFGITCMEIVGLNLMPVLIFKRNTYLKYDILVLVEKASYNWWNQTLCRRNKRWSL